MCAEHIWPNFPSLVVQHNFWKHFFLMKHVFYCPCKFIAPQGNILQEQKMSEAKKNKNGISGRKNYIHSFCKPWDPSVCAFLKDHLVQLYTVYLLCLPYHCFSWILFYVCLGQAEAFIFCVQWTICSTALVYWSYWFFQIKVA